MLFWYFVFSPLHLFNFYQLLSSLQKLYNAVYTINNFRTHGSAQKGLRAYKDVAATTGALHGTAQT